MPRVRLLAVLIAAVTALTGCVDRSSYATPNAQQRVAEHILIAAPRPQHRLGVDFEGKVLLLGYDVSKKAALPGETVTVTWYWQCNKAPGPGWRLLTHIFDGAGVARANLDRVGPIRESFQPEHWQAGMFIRDVQELEIPRDWSSMVFEPRVGLWHQRGRMRPSAGKAVVAERALGPRIVSVTGGAPTWNVARATVPPVIDGEIEGDAAWRGVPSLPPFLSTLSGEPVPQTTEVRLLWDDQALYVAMRAADDHLESPYTEHDDELWHADAFELFLDPGADDKHYFEIQVSPSGVIFDSHLPSYRKNQNGWSSGATVKVRLDGDLNANEATDKGWSAELAIPFATLSAKPPRQAPLPGERWKANLYRVDKTAERPLFCAWSPPLRGDFHALDRFGTLVFTAGVAAPSDTASQDLNSVDTASARGIAQSQGGTAGVSQP